MSFISLSPWDLILASLLLLFNGGLSLALALGVERQIAIAAGRMVIQLLLIGQVLKYLFATVSPGLTAVVLMIMIGFAGYEVLSRQERKYKGVWGYGLGGSSILFAAILVTILALTTQVQPEPWYHPRYAVPLLGMILGNTMTGVALALNTFVTAAGSNRAAIEAQLALGFSRWQALAGTMRQALKSGFMPIINAMSASGIVALPGMMTGQILAGAAPTEAVKYQILIMFLIAGATGLGATLTVLLAGYRIMDERHRLRLDRLEPVD
jgi:putative ABC transport system permease protein